VKVAWVGQDNILRCEVARSERFELPTLGIEIRCSIQLSYERAKPFQWVSRKT
jgi:hypothetical protein